jgi:acyl-CoA hydrolase
MSSASPAAQLGQLVHDGDRLFIGTGAGEPRTLLRLLIDEVLPHRRDVELIQVAIGGSELIVETPRGRGHRVLLVAGGARGNAALREGTASLVPASMGTLEELISSGELRIDGALVAGTRRDSNGPISPGLSLDLGRSAAAAARFRAVEMNAALPVVHSVDWLHLNDSDLVVNSDDPPPVTAQRPSSEAQRQIGRLVAGLVPVRAAVELGVGQGLRGVAQALAERGGGFTITIHTGMITDDIKLLVERGVVAGSAPDFAEESVIASVALGTAEFYHWLDDNPAVQFVDSGRAHRLAHLLSLGRFVAINSAGQVDLVGQVGAPTRAGTLGGGGLPDFATAGAHSAGSIIALEARDRHGASKLVPRLEHIQLHGSAVTHVVTEFGIASLRGADARERAERLVAIAHPDDRAALSASLSLSAEKELVY